MIAFSQFRRHFSASVDDDQRPPKPRKIVPLQRMSSSYVPHCDDMGIVGLEGVEDGVAHVVLACSDIEAGVRMVFCEGFREGSSRWVMGVGGLDPCQPRSQPRPDRRCR